ncbi:hypothetical protein BDN72DRAFT_893248 [Pluteus cervinus]|uniref:Uncharacterized protein n=1 Tax=Pluteus cervinus TaxID=181527 RepID=A0ACD3B8U6_9AGAR|nr:hypothetical protein BDN72DRAFT_893248 [Pluteus cervinus]
MPAPAYLDFEELPDYSPSESVPTPRAEHVFSLFQKKQKWASLYMLSYAKSSSSLPMLLQGLELPCRVELDLSKPTQIRKVTATVEVAISSVEWAGEMATTTEDASRANGRIFYAKEHVLWDSNSNSDTGQRASLQGRHTWSFNVSLPKEVSFSDKSKDVYPTPPSFTEPSVPVNIDYRVRVSIKHGWMGGKSSLLGRFGYLPLDIADPPSPLRTMVYQEASGYLLGPDADPEGWQILPSVTTKGTLFSVRMTEIKATLAIAKPLCYSLNTPIPLILTLESSDRQALDVVSQPSMIHLHLARTLSYRRNPIQPTNDTPRHTDAVGPVTAAYFWPEAPPGIDGEHSSGDSPNKRVLRGEVLVHRILKPSFTFARLTVQYQLDFFAFEGPGFVPAVPSSSANALIPIPLISQPIKVVARRPPGVLARSFAPPGSPDLSILVASTQQRNIILFA